MVETFRAKIRAALRSGNVQWAMVLAGVVVGLRICSGEIGVTLKEPPKI